LSLPLMGFGAAAIGQDTLDPVVARACVDQAWESGIRYYDTAPMYGSGIAERRLGQALRDRPRSEFILSSKVGRLVRPGRDGAPDRWEFDFSTAGVRRSVEESLTRLGLDRIDLLYIHDPDNHWTEAIEQAWPVVAQLRDEGVVKAVGAGMTRAAMLARFVRETSMDVVLMAGQYSLLDTAALDELLPACVERNVSVVVAQALHGGLIAGVRNPQFHYRPVDADTRLRVGRISEICGRYGVPTAAAAIQFPLAHPAVTTLLTGPQTAAQLRDNIRYSEIPVPAELWRELVDAGLLRADAPIPTSD